MNKKEKLIYSIKLAINALENDTIIYDWTNQSSCNCGIVAQAILECDRHQISDLFSEVEEQLEVLETSNERIDATWKNGIKYLCPLTGKSNIVIFDKLIDAGLSKEDIVHLEYMDNKAILAKSGISIKDKKFYSNKENLILYLKAWVDILNIKSNNDIEVIETDKIKLEEELLIALANENYERAANIRDKMILI